MPVHEWRVELSVLLSKLSKNNHTLCFYILLMQTLSLLPNNEIDYKT
jgi:hypothetical protein